MNKDFFKNLKISLVLIGFLLFSCAQNNRKPEEKPVPEEPKQYVQTHYSNPLKVHKLDGNEYFVSICDPDIIQGDGDYRYLYCTNTQCEKGKLGMGFDYGPIFKSANLVDWVYAGSVFEGHTNVLSWGTKDAGVWAPSVIKVGNKYNYYYSLSTWGDENPGIGVAVGDSPVGPWTHYGKLLDSNSSGVRNSIDPQAIYIGEELYLVWGSFFGIGATKLTDDGTEVFYGLENLKDHVDFIVENNRGDKGMDIDVNFEGSYVIEHDGKYFYMGSQGTCLDGIDSTYRVKVGSSDSFFGPYKGTDEKVITDSEGNYGDLVIGPDENVAGTGHHTIVKDNVGDYWIFYHGFDINGENNKERMLFMDKISWNSYGFPYVENKKASYHEDLLGPIVYKIEGEKQ